LSFLAETKYDISFAFQFNDDSSHENYSMKIFFNELKKIVLENYETIGNELK